MTTATTRQGWPVQLANTNTTPLSWITGRVLKGDAFTILDELCRRFHAEVEPIIKAHSWGWSPRPVRGYTNVWSEHAAGTAIDLNAPAHYMGAKGTFTKAQEAAIRRILSDLGNVVVWGGTWTHRPDEMHFELRGDQALVRKVAAAIRAGKSEAHPEPPKESPNPIGVRETSSVVDWLAQRGRDSSFAARAKLAAEYGIENYRGTAEQNLTLLAYLRADTGKVYVIARGPLAANGQDKYGRIVSTGRTVPKGYRLAATGRSIGKFIEAHTPWQLQNNATPSWFHIDYLKEVKA